MQRTGALHRENRPFYQYFHGDYHVISMGKIIHPIQENSGHKKNPFNNPVLPENFPGF